MNVLKRIIPIVTITISFNHDSGGRDRNDPGEAHPFLLDQNILNVDNHDGFLINAIVMQQRYSGWPGADIRNAPAAGAIKKMKLFIRITHASLLVLKALLYLICGYWL